MLRAGLDTDSNQRAAAPPAFHKSPAALRHRATPKGVCVGSLEVGLRLLKRRVSFHAAAPVAILLLAACADKPPIVSADTSCERFRHISATPAQIKVYQDNWEVMESYADQVVGHNLEYDRQCIDPPPGAKK